MLLSFVSAVDGYSSDININQGYFPSKRYARIETQDFPEKFSIISRLKKETFTVGHRGEVLKSSVLPRVQVKVPDGAVSSGTKITLQVSFDTSHQHGGRKVKEAPVILLLKRKLL